MKTLVIYDPETKEIQSLMHPAPVGTIPPGLVPSGLSAIRTAQKVSGATHKVIGGKLQTKNATEKQSENLSRYWNILRAKRAGILASKIDTINAVRWAAMKTPEQNAWIAYRQALLDLPANTTDPRNPPWPEAPE